MNLTTVSFNLLLFCKIIYLQPTTFPMLEKSKPNKYGWTAYLKLMQPTRRPHTPRIVLYFITKKTQQTHSAFHLSTSFPPYTVQHIIYIYIPIHYIPLPPVQNLYFTTKSNKMLPSSQVFPFPFDLVITHTHTFLVKITHSFKSPSKYINIKKNMLHKSASITEMSSESVSN